MLLKEGLEQELNRQRENRKVVLTAAGLFFGAASGMPETALRMGH